MDRRLDGSAPTGEPMELLEFQAGAFLTASVTDPDRALTTATDDGIPDANITWRWYRSSSLIENTLTDGTYTVSDTATSGYSEWRRWPAPARGGDLH